MYTAKDCVQQSGQNVAQGTILYSSHYVHSDLTDLHM